MSNAYSLDLRQRAVAYVLEGGQKQEACRIFQIGRDPLYRWLRQYQAKGELAPKPRGKYASRKLDDVVIAQYIADHPDATLQELGEIFAVSAVAIWKACRRLQITRKKTLRYAERNDQARAQFQEELAEWEPHDLVYLDESGVDDALHRPYARAPRGTQVLGDVSGTHAHRISLIAALRESQLLAPMRFEGYCDTLVFNAWLEQVLLPELQPGQIVLMDNASFHKSPTTKTLIESKGCTLKYLPTYSPDLNPIEPQWAILKARLRKHKRPEQSLGQVIDAIFAMY